MTAAARMSDDDRHHGSAAGSGEGASGDARFAPFRERMRAEGLPELAIEAFRRSFEQLVEGRVRFVREDALEPADGVPELARLEDCEAAGRDALARTALVKLNGGLATSMGMTKAKSLLEIKDGLSFLDVIARQTPRDAQAERRSAAAAPHEQLPHARRLAGRARTARARARRPAPRLRAAQDPAHRPGPARARGVAEGARARVVPAGPRRSLLRARDFRRARAPARARLPVRVRLERGQPRRDDRAAHPRLDAARGPSLRDGGDRAHRRRPQGRSPGASARGRSARAARGGAVRPRRRGVLPRTSRATATSTRTTSGSTSTRCAPSWTAAAV